MTSIIFVEPDGTRREIDAPDGHSVMEVAMANGINGIVAECAGSLACATCHVVVDDTAFAKLDARASMEQDMLDFAACPPQTTSRLSCQVKVSPALAGAEFKIPEAQY